MIPTFLFYHYKNELIMLLLYKVGLKNWERRCKVLVCTYINLRTSIQFFSKVISSGTKTCLAFDPSKGPRMPSLTHTSRPLNEDT